jgi:hypothetical protein
MNLFLDILAWAVVVIILVAALTSDAVWDAIFGIGFLILCAWAFFRVLHLVG